MVIAGDPFPEAGQQVEVIDLSSAKLNCSFFPDIPSQPFYAFGTYVDEKILSCGGLSNDQCWAFDYDVNDWVGHGKMNVQRAEAAHIMMDAQDWWILGGSYGDYKQTTEIFTPGVGFKVLESFERYCIGRLR